MVKKWPFLTPLSDLVFLIGTRKKGCDVLVCGFGTHIVYMPVPKPYPIWTRTFDAAERRSKKIAIKFFWKKRKKSIFSSYKTWSTSASRKDLGPEFKPPTLGECPLVWYRNKVKTWLPLKDPRSQFRRAFWYGSKKISTSYIFLKTWIYAGWRGLRAPSNKYVWDIT
jgi:hypothetical protein